MYIHTITPLSPSPIQALVICKQEKILLQQQQHVHYTWKLHNDETPENKEKSETPQNNTLLEARFHYKQ